MTLILKPVDYAALYTNQAFIIGLNIIAYVIDAPWLAAVVTVFMFVGTIVGVPAFGFVYKFALRPWGWVKPDVIQDNPEPHRFAQGFGAVVMLVSLATLGIGAIGLGWGLIWLVIALAALNLFGGFCVGCAFYYWMKRLNLPGFEKAPPSDTFPGMRPKVN